jgi:HEAT repeat protein
MRQLMLALTLLFLLGPGPDSVGAAAGQEQKDAVTAPQVVAAIDKLGTLEFAPRMDASRTVRRAPAAVAVPALVNAVATHSDSYVRFRALVLLSGFNDPRTRDVMLAALGDKNDRLRTVAYTYFEHTRDPQVLPRLLDALGREESEFVRPALLRAVVAYASDPRAREQAAALVMRGQDFFRSAVIEAVGDYKGAYALEPLTTVARLDGPLQDDAVMALGKIGDKKALATFVELQRTAPRHTQPAVAAGICLLGVNCSSHQGFLVESLKFAIANPGFQELLRSSSSGLAALAVSGHPEAAAALLEHGIPSRDPARAAIALALGAVALRNPDLTLKLLQSQANLDGAVELLRESFDMLEEDFAEERFFVAVRRAYWQASADPQARKIAEALIRKLEF